nr:hypothetical protein BCU54_20470 [Vibrio lentus]
MEESNYLIIGISTLSFLDRKVASDFDFNSKRLFIFALPLLIPISDFKWLFDYLSIWAMKGDHMEKPQKRRLLRTRDLEEILGVSRTTIWRLRRAKAIPAPSLISCRIVVWEQEVIDEWVKQQFVVEE